VKTIKVNKHTIRADKIVAVEEGKFITNFAESTRGGYMCAIIYLESGHTISTTVDYEKVMEQWLGSMNS
jgi:hypothetical protein